MNPSDPSIPSEKPDGEKSPEVPTAVQVLNDLAVKDPHNGTGILAAKTHQKTTNIIDDKELRIRRYIEDFRPYERKEFVIIKKIWYVLKRFLIVMGILFLVTVAGLIFLSSTCPDRGRKW